ncbi:MAG TPA: hypothetical protein VHC22_26765 [Pirellulales bacterium]|nr:hypothetical protein [Pirellulales bacterium]
MSTPAYTPGTLPVYNVLDYGAIGDGTTDNTTAFINAINAIQSSGGPGILYVPSYTPNCLGYVVQNGRLTISQPNIVLQGAGSMGSNGGGVGASTILGNGSGSTFTISAMGCTVRDLAFKPGPTSSQSGSDSYLNISFLTGPGGGQITVSNVHMESPFIGITLYQPPTYEGRPTGGNYWIERVVMEGGFVAGGGGINANVGGAAINIRHVIMYNTNGPASQPGYGIQVTNAAELIICDGTDIDMMGSCLNIVPGTNQAVGAVLVSDSLFDTGNGAGCVTIFPTGNGWVQVVRFSNVWTSTQIGVSPNTSGFFFDGLNSTPPAGMKAIQDVSLVNCLGQGFNGHAGLFAAGVDALSVTSSTFSGNAFGIYIYNNMYNFILNGNKCGPFSYGGANTSWGILINAGCDHYVISNNLLNGNGAGGLADLGLTDKQIGLNQQT